MPSPVPHCRYLRMAGVIITPHPGEMARLCGCSIADVKAHREEIALSYAKENNCIVVLKEHRTLIASPQGELWRNTTGNSGLARGGSGDILAGMMASFAATGMAPLDAAICSVWLHGAAAERCSRRMSETVMLPHNIFFDLGKLFLEQGIQYPSPKALSEVRPEPSPVSGSSKGNGNNKMEEIQIRAAIPGDAPALLDIYRPYVEQTAITFEYEVPSPANSYGASPTLCAAIRISSRNKTATSSATATHRRLKREEPMTGPWK